MPLSHDWSFRDLTTTSLEAHSPVVPAEPGLPSDALMLFACEPNGVVDRLL